jgi:hypothetical protein
MRVILILYQITDFELLLSLFTIKLTYGYSKKGYHDFIEYGKFIQNIEKRQTDKELLLPLFTIKLTNI